MRIEPFRETDLLGSTVAGDPDPRPPSAQPAPLEIQRPEPHRPVVGTAEVHILGEQTAECASDLRG